MGYNTQSAPARDLILISVSNLSLCLLRHCVHRRLWVIAPCDLIPQDLYGISYSGWVCVCVCVRVGGRAEKWVCVGDFVFGCDSVRVVCLLMRACLFEEVSWARTELFKFIRSYYLKINNICTSLSVHLLAPESRCQATEVLCWEEFALGLRWRRREIGREDKTWKSWASGRVQPVPCGTMTCTPPTPTTSNWGERERSIKLNCYKSLFFFQSVYINYIKRSCWSFNIYVMWIRVVCLSIHEIYCENVFNTFF